MNKVGMLLCVLLLGAGVVAAQTDTIELEFEAFSPLFFELTEVGIAEGWEYTLEEDSERVILDSETDEIQIQFYDSLEQDDFFDIDLEMPADEALANFYADLYDIDIDIDDVSVSENEDETIETAFLEFSPDNVTYLVNNSDIETVYAADTYNITGDPLTDEQLDIIEQVLMSVRLVGTEDTENTEATGDPCVITVDEDDTVQLRVGPGENRTVIAFVGAGEYTPTGQTTVDDESQWFQLDKEEAAPGSSANEIWVAEEDVSTEGDCNAVADAAAPAIIPGVVAPPPSTDSNDGASAGGEASTASTLQAGTYTINYTTVSGSCASDEYEFAATSPAELGFTPEVVNISVNANSIAYDGDVYTLSEDGQYFGTFNVPEENGNAQVYLRATSPTSLQGRFVVNLTLDDGVNCSATVGMSVTR